MNVLRRLLSRSDRGTASFYSIQKRIFRIIMVAVVICSVMLSGAFIVEANRLLTEREFLIIEKSLSSTASNINHLLDDANYIYDVVSSDRTTQTYLMESYASDEERYAAEIDITSVLNVFKMYNSTVESVSLIGSNGLHANSQSYSFRDSVGNDQSAWYGVIDGKTEPQWFVSEENMVLVSVQGKQYISLGGSVRSPANGDYLGALFIDISAERVNECVNNTFESEIIIADAQGNQLLTVANERGRIYQNGVVAPKSYEGEFLGLTAQSPVRLETGEYLFFTQLNNGWYVIDVVPSIVSNSGIMVLCLVMFVALSVIIISSYFFAKKLSIDITQRLVNMTKDIRQVESGDFSVTMDTSGNDEITVLAKQFNSLLQYINVLVNTLYAKQEELAEAELKTLQAQIKPHFLYNTLDTVAWMARFNRTKDIETIVMALTTYFRLGLNAGDDIISLNKELEHVKSYMTIQMYRYYENFKYVFEIDDELKRELDRLCLPKLTLQPLVENAIYHGLKEKQGAGILRISVRREEKTIIITVEDDGHGIDQQTLEELNHLRDVGDHSAGAGYGLKNVDNRIRKFFGEMYGLSFESEIGEGTRVILRIPDEKSRSHYRGGSCTE